MIMVRRIKTKSMPKLIKNKINIKLYIDKVCLFIQSGFHDVVVIPFFCLFNVFLLASLSRFLR
jgi:hypothetical protein